MDKLHLHWGRWSLATLQLNVLRTSKRTLSPCRRNDFPNHWNQQKEESILKEIQTIQVKWCEILYFHLFFMYIISSFPGFPGFFREISRVCAVFWKTTAWKPEAMLAPFESGSSVLCAATGNGEIALGMGRILELMVDSIYNRTGKVCLVHEIIRSIVGTPGCALGTCCDILESCTSMKWMINSECWENRATKKHHSKNETWLNLQMCRRFALPMCTISILYN